MTIVKQLEIFTNPFDLSFTITGSDSQWFEIICIAGPNVPNKQLIVGEYISTREKLVHRIRTFLANVLENSAKVFDKLPDTFDPNHRFLTKEMVDRIVATLEQPHVWGINTYTKEWKKCFLTKEDGLVAGQKIAITYTSGLKNGETFHTKLDADIIIGYHIALKGEKRDGGAVQHIEPEQDGSFTITTSEYTCTIVIEE